MKKCICIALVFALASGCATQTFEINRGAGSVPDRQKMQSFYLSGIGQKQRINAAKTCGGPSKVARVETHKRFFDGVVSVVTLGIYTPRIARVYCRL